jgi:hypothetical protein
VLKISILKLKPSGARLNGSVTGEAHAEQVAKLLGEAAAPTAEILVLDFQGVESASSSYLKRLLNPLLAPSEGGDDCSRQLSPVVVNVESADLKEDLEDYLNGHHRALICAKMSGERLRFGNLLGQLDGAAEETFDELRQLKQATAAQLYERHGNRTTNQTAWNNRLAQLVELRIARRKKDGRFWIYQPTIAI